MNKAIINDEIVIAYDVLKKSELRFHVFQGI